MLDGHALRDVSPDDVNEIVGSVPPKGIPGRHRLSDQKLVYAREYVLNGGVGRHAAIAAGCEWPDKAHARYSVNPGVQAEIQRLSIIFIKSKLPQLIAKALEIIDDPEMDAKARVAAIFGLMDRAGMKPRNDPAVQVNVQINGAAAQSAIAEVWQARSKRMNADLPMPTPTWPDEMSDIPDTMSDSDETAEDDMIELDAVEVPGGGEIEGSLPPSVSIPTLSTEQEPNSPVSIFEDGE